MRHYAGVAVLIAAGLASLGLATPPALGQERDRSLVDITAAALGHNIYMLTGNGEHITVAVGGDGIILVDSDYAPLHDKIKAKIAGLSPLPIKYIVNTHYHADHTGGNEAFAKDGAIIVAHENLAKWLANPPPVAIAGRASQPASTKLGMPAQTYRGQGAEVKVAGQTAELIHLENAQSDGDTVVFWPAADVISTGDIVDADNYPGIDLAAGGGIDGMIAAAEFILAHCDVQTKIVPGRGPVIGRKEMAEYVSMLKTARARIAAAKAKGMGEDDVMKAHLLADLDKRWLTHSTVAAHFPLSIYESLKN